MHRSNLYYLSFDGYRGLGSLLGSPLSDSVNVMSSYGRSLVCYCFFLNFRKSRVSSFECSLAMHRYAYVLGVAASSRVRAP